MKALFLTALNNMIIPGLFGRGFRLSETQFVSNDSRVVKGLFTKPLCVCAGKLEIEALMKAGAVLYSIEDFNPSENTEAEPETKLNDHLFFTRAFLMCLWLVKDNGVTSELGFFEYPYKSRDAKVSSNFLSASFFDACGRRGSQQFSRDELEQARHFLHNFLGVNGQEFQFILPHPTVPLDTTRFERAWLFAQVARNASSLDMKISHYITCMESLLSTDSAELSHKLSERVAFLLGRQLDDRKQIYATMKTAYNIRSKTVHGDRLSSKDVERATGLSTTCDNLLRQTLVKIWSSPKLMELFSGKKEALEEYLISLTFEGGESETNAPST
jgi:Apea-like HEPN